MLLDALSAFVAAAMITAAGLAMIYPLIAVLMEPDDEEEEYW